MPGAPRLRVVLDTNIYIAAFNRPRGRNGQLWLAAIERRYRLLVSAAIIKEVARVLRADFAWHEAAVQETVRVIARTGDVVVTRTRVDAVSADPDDNRILECAVDGRADLVVTNDRHLLGLGACRDIPIVAGPDLRRTLGLV